MLGPTVWTRIPTSALWFLRSRTLRTTAKKSSQDLMRKHLTAGDLRYHAAMFHIIREETNSQACFAFLVPDKRSTATSLVPKRGDGFDARSSCRRNQAGDNCDD